MNVTPGDPLTPARLGPSTPPRSLLIYYDREGTIVSNEWVQACGHRYRLGELRHFRVMHTQHSDLTIASTLVALAAILAIARVWDRLDPYGWIGALTTLAVPVGLAFIGVRLRRRSHVLIAEYRGHTTLILAERSLLRFNQVTRAIHRATEPVGDAGI